MKKDYLILFFGILLFSVSITFLFYSFSAHEERVIEETDLSSTEEFSGKSYQVVVESGKFDPDYLEIGLGDKVEWVNEDVIEHSITFEDVRLDQELPVQGTVSYVFTESGEARYFSKFSPGMEGVILVK
ncbi:MAG: cupredoxin domain-containing protein [Candidatus Woesearchaeota archaeon]